MGKITGFKEFDRVSVPYRPADLRLDDYEEIYTPPAEEHLKTQGARCMNCGVPFCQSNHGCPVDNLIPEWNDLVYNGRWKEALDRLHATNNFPEFTGRVCPAPCEGACVLGINEPAVTIKNLENAIIDRGFEEGWVSASQPKVRTGKTIAIVGSGPAGLAAAAQLNQAGHHVTVYERDDRIGGLLMYGIPNMKLEKDIVDRRVQLLRDEGIQFRENTNVGKDISARDLLDEHDVLLLATGATKARDLNIPGRDGSGVHLAMEFLTYNTKSYLNSGLNDGNYISAKDKNVIVIGGGDTGTDCIATSLRHGCKSLVNFELFPKPPDDRSQDNPWPLWPRIHRIDYGHAESEQRFGEDPRKFSISSKEILRNADGSLNSILTIEVDSKLQEIPGSEKKWDADLILLSMGFLQPEHYINDQLGLDIDERGNFLANKIDYRTSLKNVYATADCRRGQDLVVRAINEGREVARAIDFDLMGASNLP
jgi:glutamate synthase (NADPH/NADH) small chain